MTVKLLRFLVALRHLAEKNTGRLVRLLLPACDSAAPVALFLILVISAPHFSLKTLTSSGRGWRKFSARSRPRGPFQLF